MTFVAKPRTHHPRLPVNEVGLTRRDYEGSVSTCALVAVMTRSGDRSSCAELSLPHTGLLKRRWLLL